MSLKLPLKTYCTLDDILIGGSGLVGLVAEHVGGIYMSHMCSLSTSLRDAVKGDALALRILQRRARFVAYPCASTWGLTVGLDLLLQDGAKGCCDGQGAVIIGSGGLR